LRLPAGAACYLSSRILGQDVQRRGLQLLAAAAAVLAAAGVIIPQLIASLAAAETPVRIAACAALLGVMGVFLGTLFPIGMRLATASRPQLAPWLWGVDGATSALASVLAVVIALVFCISGGYWTGVA